MSTTMTHTRKSTSTSLTSELDSRGLSYTTGVNALGMLSWTIEGETLTPGQAADKYLVGGFAGNCK